MNRKLALLVLIILIVPMAGAFAQDETTTSVDAIKEYLVEHGGAMLEHVNTIQADAQAYYDLLAAADFDYAAAWDAQADAITELVTDARAEFILAHNDYELIEGIVAGVPSLADFDVWIDAGPTGEEDPEEAHDWTLTLDDGREFVQPGNIFHWLLEPTLWGTIDERTGLRVDFDGNGQDELGDALPDAHYFLGIADAFVTATTELNDAIGAWTPSLEDSFTALVTMIPTMGDYFQEWKNSTFVAGDDPRFVAQSRLVDVKGIATSLDVIYGNVGPQVASQDTTLDEQISAGFADLLTFLDDTRATELEGDRFSAEEADLLGEQAQVKADSLAALVGQGAALLELDLPLE
ncbi:MAG: EfeM/EfeO family lipoprotein [Anaerolineae bacterium]|nr:EfeM/EfeO family lipoprotein [Anaerolineae bacterium]